MTSSQPSHEKAGKRHINPIFCPYIASEKTDTDLQFQRIVFRSS